MHVGEKLRRAREERGLSLDDLSRITRVNHHILEAIERNDRTAIPPRPFGRGFVRNYASEVGLDPDEIVHEFFTQFAPPSEPPRAAPAPQTHEKPLPARRSLPVAPMFVWGLAAAVAAFVGFYAMRNEAPSPARVSGQPPETGATGTAGRSASSAVAPAANTGGVTVSLEATGPAWVTAVVDGRRVIYRTLRPGEREVLRGREEIRIRTGDAGALRLQVDRGPLTAMGRPGEVRTARITPDSARPQH